MNLLDLRKIADVSAPASLANRLRGKRFALFSSLIDRLPRPVRIIDIGGTLDYWQQRGWVGKDGVSITVVNLHAAHETRENVTVRRGNALDLSEFADSSFDVAYSNSVIEHLFSLENQMRMAAEVRRVAKAFWIQTPNYWFPIEPHFHVPGWQWMPRRARVEILMRFRCGWRGPMPERQAAEALVDEVRLMTARETKRLFPGASLWREKFLGLSKSLVMYGGFDHGQTS